MDGDDAPCALHAELFKEGRGHDGFIADKGVGIQQSSADDADEDDGKASAEDLAAEADDRTSRHGTQICDHLGDGDGIGGKVVLVLNHEWVDVLTAMRHEVEAGHEQDEVDEEQPVPLQGDFALGEESVGDVPVGLPHRCAITVRFGFWKAKSEDDDQDGWAGAEPVQWSPAVRGGIDKTASKGCGQQVSEGITLL